MDLADNRCRWRLRMSRRRELERAMRSLVVVVVDVNAEHLFEVAAVDDQQPVQTFGADGPDEALGDPVRLRRPHRRLDDPDAFAAADVVEGEVVLAVAVADQEADALIAEVETEVACLLGYPGAGRVGCAAGEPDAPARMRDEEEHVVTAQQDAFDSEEIAGDDARRLRAQELAPAGSRPPRCWLQLRLGEQPADTGRRHPEAELHEFAADPAMAPTRVLPSEPQHQLANLRRQFRPSTPTGRLSPLPTDKRLMPAQERPRREQKHAPRRAGEMQRRGSEQRPIGWLELRPRDLSAQDLELVPKHQQLDVFHVQPAAASNKRADQSPNGEVEERESHAGDPPRPRLEEERHE